MLSPIRLLALGAFFLTSVVSASNFTLPDDLTPVERERFKRFESFQIKGVCGDWDFERLSRLGVNTVRGYTISAPEEMTEKLDRAHQHGLKYIMSEWMPHQGENKGKNGSLYNFDYDQRGDQMVANFIEKLEGIGDHPAILMWGFGNEVRPDEAYLRVVNRMSLAVHERYPHHITSLTMINAKPEAIEAVKEFAPDVDVLGIQSYSAGAVRGGIRNTEKLWGKPFYYSEFNTNGPWNMRKTDWGAPLGEPVTRKVADLKRCYEAIDASSLCLGSTIFVWGQYATAGNPSYFSLLLDPDPEGLKDGETKSETQYLITPQAEVMFEHFTGRQRTGNRAPVLSVLEFQSGDLSKQVGPGEPIDVQFDAEDADGDEVTPVSWIVDGHGNKGVSIVSGPIVHDGAKAFTLTAPLEAGEYQVLVYAVDRKGGASAAAIPFKVAVF